MTASTSSLVLPSLTSNTLSLYCPKPNLLSGRTLCFPLNLNTNLVCASDSFLHCRREIRGLSTRFVRKIAVSSEFEQEEEVFSDEDERTLSADLKLFVGNLPFSVDSARLAGIFENAGNVEMVEVIYDKTTGRSRGFGFVTMSSADEAEAAAQQFNGYELDGRALRVNAGPPPPKADGFSSRGDGYSSRGDSYSSRGASGGGSESANRVYVGNLPWGVDNIALEDLFGEKGNVLEAKVVYDRESGRSRGFGFVTYNTAEEVNNAIESLNGIDLNGRSIRVTHAEARQRRSF